eukprot:SAG31_NODE_1034_length_10228_cov_89.107316_8_plen_169_part_00
MQLAANSTAREQICTTAMRSHLEVGEQQPALLMQTLSRLVPYISRLKSRISRIVAQKRESNTPYPETNEADKNRHDGRRPDRKASGDTHRWPTGQRRAREERQRSTVCAMLWGSLSARPMEVRDSLCRRPTGAEPNAPEASIAWRHSAVPLSTATSTTTSRLDLNLNF